MTISPLVIATSVDRKEQRSALYQQLASLILQSGAMMLLIGLTTVMFNAIQNSSSINNLGYFTKIVTQSILYLGCAMMLMTGCSSLNRFIGENVSANTGRDMMLGMGGLIGGISTAGNIAMGTLNAAKDTAVGTFQTGKGIGQLAKGSVQTVRGAYNALASMNNKTHSGISEKMHNEMGKGLSNMTKGSVMKQSSNPITRTYGRILETRGKGQMENTMLKWNFADDKYNKDYLKGGMNLAREGINNIKNGFGGAFDSVKNIGNPHSTRYKTRPKIRNYNGKSDGI